MDGILIIDKPAGMTSHDVVNRARKILKEKRIGHTGTLDPFATGVLVLLVGRATRLAQFLNSDVKEYEATVRFGFETDTGDLTGSRRQETGDRKQEEGEMGRWGERAIKDKEAGGTKQEAGNSETGKDQRPKTEDQRPFLTNVAIEEALESLRGEILQTPPMYSAKKVKGKKLYELARLGEEIEREAVRVIIHEFVVIKDGEKFLYDNEDGTTDMNIRVKCSAGTYIRVLAESLGRSLSTKAHLASLRRTKAGDFDIKQSITLERLQEAFDKGELNKTLLQMKTALSNLYSLHLTPADAGKIRNGVALMGIEKTDGKSWSNDELVGLFNEKGDLIAIAFYNEEKKSLQPKVVLAAQE